MRKTRRAPAIQRLNPGLRDGTLRVIGRLQNAPVSFDLKTPIILPKGHLSNLIIREYHLRGYHSGASHTWSLIRERFWLIGGMSAVKRLVHKCITCRKRSAPANTQFMADLPKERITPCKAPFKNVGIDNFGPFLVKQNRSTPKRWALIVCCMASRAVHMEIVHSLDASSCINALRRCMARRGRIKSVFCDNGTNFTSANKILRKELSIWNSSEMGKFYRQEDIEFHFNPPAASHFGGFYERLIKSARRVLANLLHEQIVSDEVLATIFCEVENQLNSRPLTPILIDPESESPLTPNHLLLFKPQSNLPPGLFDKKDCYNKRRWRQVQFIADQFWSRWTKEYLVNLQTRQKWFDRKQNLKQDDLVLIVDNTQPRGKWMTGRVIETISDKHGAVRQVILHTSRGQVRRAVNKLCLLISSSESE